MPTDRAELLSSLEKHNATFTTLLSLIPAQYYIAPTQEEADSKWMKNKKRKTGEEIKENKRKAKASKLDPENNKTTADILLDDEPSNSAKPAASASAGGSAPALTPLPPPTSISSLRQKLADRLASFRKHRGVMDDEEDEDEDAGGPSSRDELEADLRRRRGEIRDKRRDRRKEERRAAEKEKVKKPEKSKTEVTARGARTQLIVPQLPAGDQISYNISLPQSSSSGGVAGSSKSHAPLKKLSNPTQALAHLQKHNAHLAGMDEEKRAAAEERERWAKAEARAEGTKVADSEKILKKAVKRLEKGKSKSGKEWVERKKTLAQAQQTAIKKRNDNLASRAEARRNKKFGIKKKTGDKAKGGKGGGAHKGGDKGKGKGRPGFEGKGGSGAGGKGGKPQGKKGK